MEFINGKLDVACTNRNEYIIRDDVGITLGRLFLLDIDDSNKNCIVKRKIYKKDKYSVVLSMVLEQIIDKFFTEMTLFKIQLIVDEDIPIEELVDLGFNLEGVLYNSLVLGEERGSQYIFSIERDNYNNGLIRNHVLLSGKNIDLKLLTPEYAEDMCTYYINNKERLREFEPARNEDFYTERSQRNILIEGYKQYLNGISIAFGIFRDRELIGRIQCSNIVEGIFKNGIVGYSIDKFHEGKGYMKEALQLFIEYAFEEMELHRLEASVLVDNEKSKGVLKACNFKELGLNEKYLYINGKWRDHITYYLINSNM